MNILIKGLENVKWTELNDSVLPQNNRICKHKCYYGMFDSNTQLFLAYSQIGSEPHPFIDNVSNSMWYPYESSGFYIVGYDMKKQVFFTVIL